MGLINPSLYLGNMVHCLSPWLPGSPLGSLLASSLSPQLSSFGRKGICQPLAARIFLRAARDTPFRSVDAATALVMSSDTGGPTALGRPPFLAFFVGAFSAGTGGGAVAVVEPGSEEAAGAVSDIIIQRGQK